MEHFLGDVPGNGETGTAKMIRVNAQYDVEHRPGMTVQDVLDALKFSFHMIVV